MPRNSAGVYSLPGAYNPVVTDDLITSAWANTTLSDIATALSNSLDRNGNGGMLAPLRFSDGTAAAPGITFTNEPTTGIGRAGAGDMFVSVMTTVVADFLADQINFRVIPTSDIPPTAPAHLTRKSFTDATYAALAGCLFTGAPRWVNGSTVLDDELVNKAYVTALAFSAALPDSSIQPYGSQLVITPAGVVAWSLEPTENESLGVLKFCGA